MEEIRHSCFRHPVRMETAVCMDMYLDLVYTFLSSVQLFPPESLLQDVYFAVVATSSIHLCSLKCLTMHSWDASWPFILQCPLWQHKGSSELSDEQKPTDNLDSEDGLTNTDVESQRGFSHLFSGLLQFSPGASMMRERCPICRPCWGVRAHNSRFSNVCVSCLVVSNSLQPQSLPGPSVHGILQARTLEWVAISFSKRNYRKKKSQVAQLCPALCNPMDCILPGSSIHGIFQARVLEWGAISFSNISPIDGGYFVWCLSSVFSFNYSWSAYVWSDNVFGI